MSRTSISLCIDVTILIRTAQTTIDVFKCAKFGLNIIVVTCVLVMMLMMMMNESTLAL